MNPYWKRTFISAFIAQILSILGFSFAMPFLPFFIGELGVTDSGDQAFWAGLILSAAGLTFAISAPIWGVMADLYGRKSMVCRAMFGGATVLLLMSFVQTLPQLLLCRLMQGVLSGTMSASVALVASVVPKERSGFALGMMQAAVFVGNSIGPFFGGILADAVGYRASFRAGALLVLLGGLLILFGTHESFTPPNAEQRAKQNSFKQIFLLKGFFVAVLIMFGVRLSNTIVNPSFPLIVKDILPGAANLNSITGSAVAVAALGGALAAAVLGHLTDRLGHRQVLVACCLFAGLASVGHFMAASIGQLFIARILFGLSVAGMLPAANAMIHSIIDQGSLGKAYGLATSLSMFGTAVGPLVGGSLAKAAGLRIPFLVAAGAQLLMGLMVMLLVQRKPRV